MMVWFAYLYIAFMLISLPVGVVVLRRLKRDVLHPFGGVLSTLISIAFVLSAWFPEWVPFQGYQTWALLAFVIGWDVYTYFEVRNQLPELLGLSEDASRSMDHGSMAVGLLMMVPAYASGLYVCMRAAPF